MGPKCVICSFSHIFCSLNHQKRLVPFSFCVFFYGKRWLDFLRGDDVTGWGLLEPCERCGVTDGAFLRDVRGDGQRKRRGANCGDRPVQALCCRAAGTLEAAVTSPGKPESGRSEADTASEDSR